MVLLDWEKAFDKIDHDAMWTALTELGLPEMYINNIKALYQNPQFRVKEDGQTTAWYKQKTGIRQGCPLSPYLFILVNHCHVQSN